MYIQSAGEMEQYGARMKQTAMGMLRNLEEHELYLYQLDDKDRMLETRIAALEKGTKESEERIAALEKAEKHKNELISELKKKLAAKKY